MTLRPENGDLTPPEKDDLPGRPVRIRDLARNLSLSPTTLSLVLNGSPGADAIPQETKDRIFAEARRLNYIPNFLARSLRAKRTYAVGVIVPEMSYGYTGLVISGIEEHLLAEGYMYLITTHRHKRKLIDEYPKLLLERRVEGLIVVDTPLNRQFPLPLVSVSGHDAVPGYTNIILNHEKAADLALRHLAELGHRRIAFIKGQTFSSDTAIRWLSIEVAARSLGLEIDNRLIAQLEGSASSPKLGYIAARKILEAGAPFTALFTFNDLAAFGAIRAFQESGLRVPQDVSVIGFDDVYAAAYHIPALTTIHQPLDRMGTLAAETLLRRIRNDNQADRLEQVEVDPELIVRESTAPPPSI